MRVQVVRSGPPARGDGVALCGALDDDALVLPARRLPQTFIAVEGLVREGAQHRVDPVRPRVRVLVNHRVHDEKAQRGIALARGGAAPQLDDERGVVRAPVRQHAQGREAAGQVQAPAPDGPRGLEVGQANAQAGGEAAVAVGGGHCLGLELADPSLKAVDQPPDDAWDLRQAVAGTDAEVQRERQPVDAGDELLQDVPVLLHRPVHTRRADGRHLVEGGM